MNNDHSREKCKLKKIILLFKRIPTSVLYKYTKNIKCRHTYIFIDSIQFTFNNFIIVVKEMYNNSIQFIFNNNFIFESYNNKKRKKERKFYTHIKFSIFSPSFKSHSTTFNLYIFRKGLPMHRNWII